MISTPSSQTDNSTELYVRDYLEKGYTVLRNFFSPEEIATIKKEVELYKEAAVKELSGRDINFINGEINSIHKIDLKADNFFTRKIQSPEIQSIITALLNDTPECRGSEFFLKPPFHGLPSPIHQDNFYWCIGDANALTFWISLEGSNSENGGIFYYEGSHHKLLEHKDSFAPGSSQTIADPGELKGMKVVIPKLNPGDVAIHHSLTVHGSGPNKSAQGRQAWTIQFKGKNSSYDQKMLNHYLSRLEYQIKLRENKN